MKDKDILKVIKKDIVDDTPNLLSKIDIKDIEIDEVVTESKRTFFNFSNVLRLSLSLGVLVIGLVLGYSLLNKKPVVIPGTKVSVTSKDQIVAAYAVTGVNLIGNNNNAINISSSKMNTALTVDFIEKFHENINLIQDYFNLNKTSIIITVNDDEAYDTYKYKMVVTITNQFENEEEYILYYNEERSIDDDDDEEEKQMNGVLIYDFIKYHFHSEEEIESDESEIKVIVYQTTFRNRIEIEKELEQDEYQYEYTIYRNDNEIFILELEVEDNEIELKIETKDYEYEYIIRKISKQEFLIKFDKEEDFSLRIDLENKVFIYEYMNELIYKE